jgi:type I restriction enzyme R subunit
MAEELEWKTRKERIDKKLKSLNPPWSIIKYHDGLDISTLQCHAVEECPTANGPADYTLFAKGKLLGIIEAKKVKVKVSPQNVLEQAKRYSKGAFDGAGNWNGYRVPFLFSSNGEVVWFLDVRDDKISEEKSQTFIHLMP